MKLSSFGNRYALAFALALAGALAACGGDDNNTGGAGGSAGSGGGNLDAAKGGGGNAEASPDRAPDRATGGSAGTGGAPDSSAGGSGGAAPDAAEAATGTGGSPEAASDVTRPPDAPPDVPVTPTPDAGPDVRPPDAGPDTSPVADAGPDVAREAEAGPVLGSDATDVTPPIEAAPEPRPEPTPEPVPEAGPVVDANDGGTQLLYGFEANDQSVMDWRVDLTPGTLTPVNFITPGAPGSLLGAIEFSGSINTTHAVYVDYVDAQPDGLEGDTVNHSGFNGLSLQVRLRNALDGGSFDNLLSVQLFILGGSTSGFVTCAGDAVNTELAGGDWVTLNVANCATDAGVGSALTDLKRIAVEMNIAQNDAGPTSIVLDVDDVRLTP